MTNFQRILAVADLSGGHAMQAETRAALLCASLRINTLDLLAVQPRSLAARMAGVFGCGNGESMPMAAALRHLETSAHHIRAAHGVGTAPALRFGGAASAILTRADAIGADLTVVGIDCGNFFASLMHGGAVNQLMRRATRPLLVVRKKVEAPYRKVLVAVDFSEESKRAAKLALQIAPGAHVTFLHAFHVWYEGQMREAGIRTEVIHDYRIRHRHQARQELEQFIASLGPIAQSYSRLVQFGYPTTAITSLAHAGKADLIVMGRHGSSRIAELLIGSVTQRTIHQTTCDLLLVPSGAKMSQLARGVAGFSKGSVT